MEKKKKKRKKNGQAGKVEERCPRVGLGQGGRYIWQRRSRSSGDECGRSNKEEEEEVRKCKEGGWGKSKVSVAQKTLFFFPRQTQRTGQWEGPNQGAPAHFALFCLDAYVNGHVITSTLDRYFRDYRCILQQSMPNVVLLSWIVALMPLIVL